MTSHQPTLMLTDEQLRRVVSESMEATLIRIGLDTGNPLEMQRDLQHLRKWRQTTEAMQRHGVLAMVTLFISGTLAALLLGVKGYLSGNS